MILRREKADRRDFFRPMTLPWWVFTLLFFGSIIVARHFNLSNGARISLCPTKNCFGIPCPLCGGTQSAFLMAEGNWSGAIQTNPLAVVAIAAGVAWSTLWLVFGWRVRSTIPSAGTAALILVALAANWAYLLAMR